MYDTQNDRLLGVQELSRFLDLNDQHVRELCRTGKLPAIRLSGTYRVAESDLSRHLESLKVVKAA